MLRTLIGWTLCIAPLLASAQTPQARLEALAPGEWLSYEVPLQPGVRAPCCFSWHGREISDGVCPLEREAGNFGTRDSQPLPPPGSALRVLVRRAATGFDRVWAIDMECGIDAGAARVVEAGAAAADDSVALLQQALAGTERKQTSQAVAAIALHAGALADRTLLDASRTGQPRAVRREAIFWLAQARGEPGFRAVRELIEREPEGELRRHAVFALSISEVDDAAPELRRLATTHAEAEVRGEALFWLAQNRDPQVETIALAALRDDPPRRMVEKAVFALSQLPAARAIPALRGLVESGQPREVRKQALFWLAQVDDEAVLPVFDELLGGARR
jgi:hypothetical protein